MLEAQWVPIRDESASAADEVANSAGEAASVTEAVPDSGMRSALSASNLPRSWRGAYEDYTTHTNDGVIERAVDIVFDRVLSDGSLRGTCYVGVNEQIKGATHGSYSVQGSIDWQTGAIHLYGTEWVDQGGLIGMGGFRGTVDAATWTIRGHWYDLEGEAQDGNWHMYAV